ncbi:hypothetical protein ACP70R_001570 [Stipagrostis hirtigluma subsp. patula]
MTSPMHARKAKLKNHLVSAKAKLKHHVTPRSVLLLAAAACSVSLLLLTLRTLHSAAAAHSRGAGQGPAAATTSSPMNVGRHAQQNQQQQQGECGKLPEAVAEALVHYATSSSAGATPRRTAAEAGAAARVLSRRAPCNLLVFGLGPDSALWAALNHGGSTLFLEEDDARIASVRAAPPAGVDLEAHHVAYQHAATLADGSVVDELLALRNNSTDCAAAAVSSPGKPLSPGQLQRSPCKLAPRELPAALYTADWDVIVVEAPMPEAIYTAGVVARARRPGTGETDVVVHGVDSTAEESFTRAFLCEAYIKEEAGRLRHFSIPSHRDKDAMTFCP